MTDAQPASEHHVGTLDLSGEGNAPEERLPNDISPVAVEAATKAHIENAGWDWDELGNDQLEHEAAKAVLLADMRIALRAAYPAIREQIAEEIAVALEARAATWGTPNPVPEGWDSHHLIVRGASQTASHAAAGIAREIGGRDLDASAPGSTGGFSGRTGLSASPSDPPAGKAGRSESGGFEG